MIRLFQLAVAAFVAHSCYAVVHDTFATTLSAYSAALHPND